MHRTREEADAVERERGTGGFESKTPSEGMPCTPRENIVVRPSAPELVPVAEVLRQAP